MPMEARDYINELTGAGMTQVQIAEKTGIPQPTISKVARGEVSDVLSRNYRKLAALYESVLGQSIGSPAPAGVATQETRDAA